MKRSSRIFESLIILLIIFLFFQLYIAKGAESSRHNLENNFYQVQINRPELPIGPVVGNCLNCTFISANPIIFLELLQNADSAVTSHWFRTELFDNQKSRMVNNISYTAINKLINRI